MAEIDSLLYPFVTAVHWSLSLGNFLVPTLSWDKSKYNMCRSVFKNSAFGEILAPRKSIFLPTFLTKLAEFGGNQ